MPPLLNLQTFYIFLNVGAVISVLSAVHLRWGTHRAGVLHSGGVVNFGSPASSLTGFISSLKVDRHVCNA